MLFNKYPSIENSYRQKSIDYLYQTGLTAGEWVVQSKCHGSNFSLLYDDKEFRMAKKTALIADDENFYGCQSIKEELKAKIIAMFNKLNTPESPCTYLKLCGEIFGGTYPHPDVPKVNGAVKVQSGIWYSPKNMFYGFDIVMNNEFLDAHTALALFKEFDIFCAENLFCGSFEDCLKYPNEFQSTIPGRLGLPPIDNNICEGVVIKPVFPKYFACGSRVIFKNKNAKWSEKNNGHIPKEKMAELHFSPEGEILFEELKNLITENRLRNILSSISDEITNKDFGRVQGLFVKDCVEELRKDNQELLDKIGKDEQKRMNKLVGQLAADLLRKNFLDVIDKTF